MYCTRCGAKLTDQARFCTACGAPADGDAPKENTSADGAEQHEAKAGEAVSETLAPKTDLAEESTTTKNASFSEALDSSKMKSKRRIPFIVLVALALALLSSIAYAAYQVYTHYIAPAQQENEVAQIDETQDEGEPADAPDSVDNAMEAYDGILEEYRTAIYTTLQDANYYNDESKRAEIPHVELKSMANYEMLSVTNGGPGNIDEYSPYSGYTYTFFGYAYKDLNEDDIPELLIVYCVGTDPDDPTKAIPYPDHAVGVPLFDLYTFENGEPTRFTFEEGALEYIADFNDEDTYGVIVLEDQINEREACGGAISADGTYALLGDAYGSDAHFTFEKGSSTLRLYCIVQQAIDNFDGEGTITFMDGSTETFVSTYPEDKNILEDLEVFALR